MSKFISFLLFLACAASSCKIAVYSKKAKKGDIPECETYYIGVNILQYFIKPLRFKADRYEMWADFTFRDSMSKQVTFNFSLYSDSLPRPLESIQLIANNQTITPDSVKILHTQKAKNLFHRRYSSTLSYKDFYAFFAQTPQKITVKIQQSAVAEYIPPKKTNKSIKRILDNILILIPNE